jgi:hypothetical protein
VILRFVEYINVVIIITIIIIIIITIIKFSLHVFSFHPNTFHQEGYAAMNVHQVGLGESTCTARFANDDDGRNGGALLNIVVLGEVRT